MNACHNTANSRVNPCALAADVSENHLDKNKNRRCIVEIDNATTTSFNDSIYDSPSIIGASLLPFLPSSRNNAIPSRESDIIGDASLLENGAGGFCASSAKRCRTTQCGDQDRYYDQDNSDYNQGCGCASLLLHGGIPTSTNGNDRFHPPQEGDRQPRTRTSRKRILLRGPPRSGKTSLAMNLAYAEAEKDSGLPSGCISAIVYRPTRKRHSENHNRQTDEPESSSENDRFPLFCRALAVQADRLNKTNALASKSNTNEGIDPSALANEVLATENQEENGNSWDPDTLSRIQISRVSSVFELLEDMLLLAGKPADEQPTRVIAIEDLDQIIELGGNPSDRNNFGGRNGKNTKWNHVNAAMLKIVAIASDTALAMESIQNEYLSRRSSIILLFTLTAMDSWQQQNKTTIESSSNILRGVATNGTGSSDVLTVASCVDTVVTLQERPRVVDNLAKETNMTEKDHDLVWTIPMKAASRSINKSKDTNISCTIRNNDKKKKSAAGIEEIVVHGLWQAEIQECVSDQYCRKSGDDFNGDDTNIVSLVDYAIVDSLAKEDDDFGLGECERNKELRWKHCSIGF